jgi:flavorubredoxin
VDAYRDWLSDRVANLVVLPYVSMHGSTEAMVDYLTDALVERGVRVERFNLIVTDTGQLAMALVDAATLVIATPTVHMGPHPAVFAATNLANSLRPKVRHVAIIGSYGWGTKAVEQLSGLIPNLKVEVLDTVMCKGLPRDDERAALDSLADSIQQRHALI